MAKHHFEHSGEQGGPPRAVLREVDRLRMQVSQLATSIRCGMFEDEATDSLVVGRPRAASEETLCAVIRSRAQRDKFFPRFLFADPAWDMLIDLYASNVAKRRVSVSSLCMASNVPATTALRWINTLEDEGLIVRTDDVSDKGRHFLSLTEAGLSSMDGYFASVSGLRPVTI